MKVIQNSDKYEARGHLCPWLLTLSRNTCFNVLRSRKPLGFTDDLEIDESQTDPSQETAADPLNDLLAAADNRAVRDLVDRLPEAQRTALSLLLIEELSYAEIATAMSVSLTAVKTHIFRARKSLEKDLRSRESP